MQIVPGNPELRGATPDDNGTHFALWSGIAERVELCLFDARGNQFVLDLPECENGVWHGYVPGVVPGQRYGFRVHGPWDPTDGLRCNPAKLLLDPYALEIRGTLDWNAAVFGDTTSTDGTLEHCKKDSAQAVPISIVRSRLAEASSGPLVPWSETIFYECNLRGFTMRHPDVAAEDRGRFAGMQNKQVLEYVKALGITSIEFMPLLTFVDERHLVDKGLRNYWGYNTIGFFAPMQRFARRDPVAELQEMVRAIHDAGLEVILDVAYNHTAEGDENGPTLCFRGIDNTAYYRTMPGDLSQYINDTGCGNTINADHPEVQKLVLDSLEYLHRNIGFDGFRFDLATILGRHNNGFSSAHPLLRRIGDAQTLRNAKLIAEPWDPGPGGYRLGEFPPRWAEWNDTFRDAVRRFWRGDAGRSGDFARRLHGSADVFEVSGRAPWSSVNVITTHDGFTLQDVVSYEHRHNEANGEDNRDGHRHNFSRNHGCEGETDDVAIRDVRRRQRLNLLASLFFSQGTPLLLAGDEFGNTQRGNNNAYAQDNETSWLDWSLVENDPHFAEDVRTLIRLRREIPLLRQPAYVHNEDDSERRFDWYNAQGQRKRDQEWATSRAFIAVVSDADDAAALVVNGREQAARFSLPAGLSGWNLEFSNGMMPDETPDPSTLRLKALSVAVLHSR